MIWLEEKLAVIVLDARRMIHGGKSFQMLVLIQEKNMQLYQSLDRKEVYVKLFWKSLINTFQIKQIRKKIYYQPCQFFSWTVRIKDMLIKKDVRSNRQGKNLPWRWLTRLCLNKMAVVFSYIYEYPEKFFFLDQNILGNLAICSLIYTERNRWIVRTFNLTYDPPSRRLASTHRSLHIKAQEITFILDNSLIRTISVTNVVFSLKRTHFYT